MFIVRKHKKGIMLLEVLVVLLIGASLNILIYSLYRGILVESRKSALAIKIENNLHNTKMFLLKEISSSENLSHSFNDGVLTLRRESKYLEIFSCENSLWVVYKSNYGGELLRRKLGEQMDDFHVIYKGSLVYIRLFGGERDHIWIVPGKEKEEYYQGFL